MKLKRTYVESNDTEVIPIELSTREVKVIQNYMNKDMSLNDPKNKECLEIVLRILSDIVANSDVENLEIRVSNALFEDFGIDMDIDPYGKNSGIEISKNGLIELKETNNPKLAKDGEYANYVEGGFWDDNGNLTNGFISIDSLNEILNNEHLDDSIKSIQLKKDGYVARIMMDM